MNSAMIELREKVRRFGVHVVPQIIDKNFAETDLVEMKDADLVSLCLSLNLLPKRGISFSTSAARVRNSFSSRPPTGRRPRRSRISRLSQSLCQVCIKRLTQPAGS